MNKILKILLIVLGVPALAFAGLVIYEVAIGLPKSPSEAPPVEPLSEEAKKPAPCFFTREPEETWPDETVNDLPIGNVELIKKFHFETYDVFGSNLYEVTAAMNENGPIIIKEKLPTVNMSVKGVAFGHGLINPIWYRKNTAAGCTITQANVTINMMLLLPKWADEASAPDQDQKWWDLYLKFLERHEQGHINIALKEAREFQAELAQLKPAPSCQDNDNNIRVLFVAVEQKGIEDSVNYDKRTNHGTTQRPDFSTCNWSEIEI
mgnify:CR=1 FL=1